MAAAIARMEDVIPVTCDRRISADGSGTPAIAVMIATIGEIDVTIVEEKFPKENFRSSSVIEFRFL